jgi:hypothetical protein
MRREQPELDARIDRPDDDRPGQGGPESGGQSGDTQGLSQDAGASEETVEELAADGQDYEAGIELGVEDAADHPERPVPSHDGQERRADAAPGPEPE